MANLGWPSDKRRLWRAGARWSVLALMVLGIGGLALFGGRGDGPTGGAGGLLSAQLAGDQQSQQAPPSGIVAASGKDIAGQAEQQTAVEPAVPQDTQTVRQDDAADQPTAADEQDVRDDAPAPWVGDAALTAEAGLLNMLAPLPGAPSRGFGYGYDATFADYRFHQGLDWEAAPGTAVQTPLDGVVKLLVEDAYYGAGIELDHGGGLVSRYYGLTPAQGLEGGQSVSTGETLGQVAESPLFEDGQASHLHWEIWLDDQPVDPADYQSTFASE